MARIRCVALEESGVHMVLLSGRSGNLISGRYLTETCKAVTGPHKMLIYFNIQPRPPLQLNLPRKMVWMLDDHHVVR